MDDLGIYTPMTQETTILLGTKESHKIHRNILRYPQNQIEYHIHKYMHITSINHIHKSILMEIYLMESN